MKKVLLFLLLVINVSVTKAEEKDILLSLPFPRLVLYELVVPPEPAILESPSGDGPVYPQYAVPDIFALTVLPPTILSAASCEEGDIQAQVSIAAASGDTIEVPAGSCTWTTAVDFSGKSIDLKGNGIGSTIITVQVNSSLQTKVASGSRVHGFTFVLSSNSWNNIIQFQGPNTRIDHNRFDCSGAAGFRNAVWATSLTSTAADGVIDANEFVFSRVVVYGNSSDLANANVIVKNPGSTIASGSFTGVVYVENNTFTRASPSVNVVDSNYASRYVFRRNTVVNSSLEAHSLSGSTRGSVSWEIYENNYSVDAGFFTCMNIRGGTGLAYSNSCDANYTSVAVIDNRRSFQGFATPMGVCDGTSDWDGRTISAISRTSNVVTVTTGISHGFATGQSMTIRGVTDTSYNGVFTVTVTSSTTFTYAQVAGDSSSSGGNASVLGWPCNGQIGLGPETTLWTDVTSPYSPLPPSMPNEPAYFFLNTKGGSPANPTIGNCTGLIKPNGSCADIVLGRDYFHAATGTIAARPATCTPGAGGAPGEGYQATDEKKLYRCTATNIWTLYRTEPGAHPLVGGGAGVAALTGTGIFPDTVVGASRDNTFTLSNTGGTTFDITSILEDSGEFSIQSNTCGASLAASASCTFAVRFTPTSTGAKTGTLTVTTTVEDPTSALSGTGITSIPAVNPVPVPVVTPPDTEAPKLSVVCPAQAKTSMTCDLFCCTDNVGVISVDINFGAFTERLIPGTLTAKKRSWNFDVSKLPRSPITFAAIAKDAAGNAGTASAAILLY